MHLTPREIERLMLHTAGDLARKRTRKVPVQYAKRIIGNKQYGGARQYAIFFFRNF